MVTATTEENITEVFALIVELAEALGVRDINQLEGCWEVEVDSAWWFALNGHGTPTEARGIHVPPFEVYVEYNGWPAGVVGPYAGVLAAGEGANEETFCAALRGRITAVKGV
jgi:hypothetical protein